MQATRFSNGHVTHDPDGLRAAGRVGRIAMLSPGADAIAPAEKPGKGAWQ